MLLNDLKNKKLISPPDFLIDGVCYLTIMGSEAYGVKSDASDRDIYGITIPPKDMVFPHLRGEILGFGRQINRFEQWEQHHVDDNGHSYDFAIYSIVKYFNLAMENNPNIIDGLFTPDRCVLYTTKIGKEIRNNRRLFLHKGCFHKFKGYAFSQLHKMKIKNPEPGSKRYNDVQEFGFDRKFGYHIVRLLLEVEQILETGDLNLECNSEILKAIRRGEWTEDKIIEYFETREPALEELYAKSELQYKPDEAKIKQLLLSCLEEQYGSLRHMDDAIVIPDEITNLTGEIKEVLSRYERK